MAVLSLQLSTWPPQKAHEIPTVHVLCKQESANSRGLLASRPLQKPNARVSRLWPFPWDLEPNKSHTSQAHWNQSSSCLSSLLLLLGVEAWWQNLQGKATVCSGVSSPFPASDLQSQPVSSALHSCRARQAGQQTPTSFLFTGVRTGIYDLSPEVGVMPKCLCSSSRIFFAPSPLCCQSLTGAAHMADSMCRGSYLPIAFSLWCPCWKQTPQLTYASSAIFTSLSEWFPYQKRLILSPKVSNHWFP